MVVNNFGMDVADAEYVKLPGLVLKTPWDGNEEASFSSLTQLHVDTLKRGKAQTRRFSRAKRVAAVRELIPSLL